VTKAVTAADELGRFRTAFRVPLATPAGAWRVSVLGTVSQTVLEADLRVRTNWPQFQRGRGHHGFNRYERVLTGIPAQSLSLAWRQATASGCTSYSSPTVVENRLYVGDYCNAVSALDAATGAPLWTVATDGKVDSTPAVVGGRVFVATGVPGHSVYAFSAVDGTTLWRYEMSSGVLSSPVVRNGVLYQSSTDGSVYAVNAATGGSVWKAQLPKVEGDLASTPVIGGDMLYVGSNDGHLYALSIRDCSLRWTGEAGDSSEPVVLGSPALAGRQVLVGSSVGLLAFPASGCDTEVCTPEWRSEPAMKVTGALAVAYGRVHLTDDEGGLWAFTAGGCRAFTCYADWRTPLGGSGSGSAGPTVAGHVVYATSSFTEQHHSGACSLGRATVDVR
jgi:outer membrane protein assembly factor BamB